MIPYLGINQPVAVAAEPIRGICAISGGPLWIPLWGLYAKSSNLEAGHLVSSFVLVLVTVFYLLLPQFYYYYYYYYLLAFLFPLLPGLGYT